MTESKSSTFTRREILSSTAAGLGAAMLASPLSAADKQTQSDSPQGRLKQSVCKWCFPKTSLDELCVAGKELGLVGIDLLGPDEFETLKRHGMVCTMTSSHKLADGLCDPKFHRESITKLIQAIEATAHEGWRNVICFSGNARGINRKTGIKNCVAALKEVVPIAEKNNVILNMELLNSKVNHPDYMCDNSAWGVELCKEVGSNNFKLLYDIYHMQIMEGDIIRTIERDHQYFGHYHTAGNPGRHEFDETQELYYPPIARKIADVGFDGYFAHEFLPTRDPIASLKKAVEVCTV